MGNPPKSIVLQKLIKKYFKVSKINCDPEALKFKIQLADCWDKYGGKEL